MVVMEGTSGDDDDEFRSCSASDEMWEDPEDSTSSRSMLDVEECCFSKMFFKGISVLKANGKGRSVSGIGVVIEIPSGSKIRVQKKLDFYAEESIAELLALMDGLLEARRNGISKIYAFTDSEKIYDQLTRSEKLEKQLLVALGQRIFEIADNLDEFVLELVPGSELGDPIRIAQGAVGILRSPGESDLCSKCHGVKKLIVELNCSHKFCAECMIRHVEDELCSAHFFIRCPEKGCDYYISSEECKSLLTSDLYDPSVQAVLETKIPISEGIHCPFRNCSRNLSNGSSSLNQTDINCVECPECRRFVCVNCGVLWHSSTVCEEYLGIQNKGTGTEDINSDDLAQINRYWQDDSDRVASMSNREAELWSWEFFDSPRTLNSYSEQEKSQLAMIQRFLSGGFGMGDDPSCLPPPPPSCSDTVADAMNDLQQLPWLERFVSVISDDYNEELIQ